MGISTRLEKINPVRVDSLTADAPAGGTGATAGAYDSAANRNLMIATVNGLNATVTSLLLRVILLENAINAGEKVTIS